MAVLLLSSLSSCEDILEQYFPKPNPNPTFPSLGLDIPFYALSGGTKLDAYSTKAPATRTASVFITGLASGEQLLAIDFRPATGQLYGVSSGSRLYVINQNTGVARAVGAGAFTPAVAGNLVGFDFNPTVDRIRLVTSTGQNLRLNPETGTVAATDGSVNGAVGATVTGVAYTNNTAGASTTALYVINPQNQQLYLVNPPNDGTLVPVGSLNLNISGDGGFDIDAKTGTALGLYTVKGKPTLFTVDLSTGAARPLAEYAANLGYSSIAIPTHPVAYSITREFNFTNNLVIFNPLAPATSANPATLVSKLITGLGAGEWVRALDFRPATGQLYAIASPESVQNPAGVQTVRARLYTINTATGAATLVAPISIEGGFQTIRDFDFNPVTDRIRILIGNTGQNLRVNPTTGEAVEVERIATPPFGFAYTNSFAGATSTTLYGLRSETTAKQETTTTLYQLTSPAENVLTEVGVTQVSTIFGGAMDIGGTSNTAYALVTTLFLRGSNLYSINLQTGVATYVGYYPPPLESSPFTVGLGF